MVQDCIFHSRIGKAPNQFGESIPMKSQQFVRRIIASRARILLSCILTLLTTACSTLVVTMPDGSLQTRYFGYLKVIGTGTPRENKVSGYETKVFGVRVGNGFGIGYFHDKQFSTPLDCRVVLILGTEDQLQRALDLFKTAIKEKELCGTVF